MVDKHQQGELQMVICGSSAEYDLADVTAHLQVPPDEWFEMCEEQSFGKYLTFPLPYMVRRTIDFVS